MRLGAGDFISKPFNVAEIISIVSKSFERRSFTLKINSIIERFQRLRSTVDDVHKNDQILSRDRGQGDLGPKGSDKLINH